MGGRAVRLVFTSADGTLTWRDVLRLWMENESFGDFFSAQLLESPHQAIRWETPPVAIDLLDRPFECAVLDSPGLCVVANVQAFAEHLQSDVADVVGFENLGGDAFLIVPKPLEPNARYAHLSDFLRHAPRGQILALWRCVGAELSKRLTDQPLWLSTAGAGVPWLHVRLDRRPKYYHYAPYCEWRR
jgi:hypothetical protein